MKKFISIVPDRFDGISDIDLVSEVYTTRQGQMRRYFAIVEISENEDGLVIEFFANYATLGNLWSEDMTDEERFNKRRQIEQFYERNPEIFSYIKRNGGRRLLYKAMLYYERKGFNANTSVTLFPTGYVGLPTKKLRDYYKSLGFKKKDGEMESKLGTLLNIL
jgi:hypothetical protein